MGVHRSERDNERDEQWSAAARSLHREWDSPALWPSIAARMRAHDQSPAGGRQLLSSVTACFNSGLTNDQWLCTMRHVPSTSPYISLEFHRATARSFPSGKVT